MKQHLNLDGDLTRRCWLVLTASAAASALTACGGGGSTLAGMPGTGGTGIYAQGSISGFGSVILNGVKYDDTGATVMIDGLSAQSLDLRLGMVAAIQGNLSTDITLGNASSIEVWSIAQGSVTSVNSTGFTIAGMTVQTDSNTVFDGVTNVAALATGQLVAVWGLQIGADGRVWIATRVAANPALNQTVSTGLISVGESLRKLNGMTLTGSPANSLTDQQLVRVQGVLADAGDSMVVSSVKLLSLGTGSQSQAEVEIEGVVTTTPLAGKFMLGSVSVDASKALYSPVGAQTQIDVNARVEVYGVWCQGVLVATNVELEDAATLNTVEITGSISQFTSLADFVVRGQRCDASSAVITPQGSAANIRQGMKVKVKGVKLGSEVLTATELVIYNG